MEAYTSPNLNNFCSLVTSAQFILVQEIFVVFQIRKIQFCMLVLVLKGVICHILVQEWDWGCFGFVCNVIFHYGVLDTK